MAAYGMVAAIVVVVLICSSPIGTFIYLGGDEGEGRENRKCSQGSFINFSPHSEQLLYFGGRVFRCISPR